MRHAVLSGGLGELVLVGEIDLVLLLLAAGLFDGGAEAAEQHVAADFILSRVGLLKSMTSTVSLGWVKSSGLRTNTVTWSIFGCCSNCWVSGLPVAPVAPIIRAFMLFLFVFHGLAKSKI